MLVVSKKLSLKTTMKEKLYSKKYRRYLARTYLCHVYRQRLQKKVLSRTYQTECTTWKIIDVQNVIYYNKIGTYPPFSAFITTIYHEILIFIVFYINIFFFHFNATIIHHKNIVIK